MAYLILRCAGILAGINLDETHEPPGVPALQEATRRRLSGDANVPQA
jgi:hypothetical protein